MPETLIITEKGTLGSLKSKTILLTIPFGSTLMIQNDKLNYWTTDYDTLDITQIQLAHLPNKIIATNKKIDLLQFSLGHNKINTELDLVDFVTYLRKEDLKYDQDYYEKFVVVFINKNDINIIHLTGSINQVATMAMYGQQLHSLTKPDCTDKE